MIKKKIRFISKIFNIWIIRFFNFTLKKANYRILPTLNSNEKFNLKFSSKTRRFILKKNSDKFGKIIIDSSSEETDLCRLGAKFKTNKSSLNLDGHRSGYTGFYNLILNHLINKNCHVAEIGIEKNASTKMWRQYFNNASIDCYEIDKEKINLGLKDKLKKVKYHFIDVRSKKIINNQFQKNKKKYDLIIDDSTHLFDHKINIIFGVYKFLKPGGILIIEDIYRIKKGYEEEKYYEKLKKIKKYFSYIAFIETPHINNYTASWKNEKILILIKK